jgi:hypothetical protein
MVEGQVIEDTVNAPDIAQPVGIMAMAQRRFPHARIVLFPHLLFVFFFWFAKWIIFKKPAYDGDLRGVWGAALGARQVQC